MNSTNLVDINQTFESMEETIVFLYGSDRLREQCISEFFVCKAIINDWALVFGHAPMRTKSPTVGGTFGAAAPPPSPVWPCRCGWDGARRSIRRASMELPPRPAPIAITVGTGPAFRVSTAGPNAIVHEIGKSAKASPRPASGASAREPHRTARNPTPGVEPPGRRERAPAGGGDAGALMARPGMPQTHTDGRHARARWALTRIENSIA